MRRFDALFFRLIDAVLVIMLSTMVVMVFGNVVLRYGFNDSIISSEELSRFLFIWITFLGAIVTLRDNQHLGLDTVVRLLPRSGRKVCYGLSNLLMLGCCVLMFYGTVRQHGINSTTRSAVVELPMIWVYGVGYVASLSMGGLILRNLWRLATGQVGDADLIQVHDSEETVVTAPSRESR